MPSALQICIRDRKRNTQNEYEQERKHRFPKHSSNTRLPTYLSCNQHKQRMCEKYIERSFSDLSERQFRFFYELPIFRFSREQHAQTVYKKRRGYRKNCKNNLIIVKNAALPSWQWIGISSLKTAREARISSMWSPGAARRNS